MRNPKTQTRDRRLCTRARDAGHTHTKDQTKHTTEKPRQTWRITVIDALSRLTHDSTGFEDPVRVTISAD